MSLPCSASRWLASQSVGGQWPRLDGTEPMRIAVARPDYSTLLFDFEGGQLDGCPPLRQVRMSGPFLGRLTDQRLALIGYLLVRDLLSNDLSFEGLKVPPFLAAAMTHDFDGDELFVSPIDDENRSMLSQKLPRRAQVWGMVHPRADDVRVEPTLSGFVIDAPGYDESPLAYVTNLPLFLSLASSNAKTRYAMIRALIALDVVNAATLIASPGEATLPDLISQVGFSWDHRDD